VVVVVGAVCVCVCVCVCVGGGGGGRRVVSYIRRKAEGVFCPFFVFRPMAPPETKKTRTSKAFRFQKSVPR
jgi:hypothetical protein